jgi:hypothetical protein
MTYPSWGDDERTLIRPREHKDSRMKWTPAR